MSVKPVVRSAVMAASCSRMIQANSMSVSRLFVEADLVGGRRGAARRGAGPLPAPRHAPRPTARRCCCSTAATANGAARSSGRGKKAAVARLARAHARAGRRSPMSGSASRRSSARASTISPRRRPSSASPVLQPVRDASHHRRAGECRAAARQCGRGGRADRAAQRARGARAGGAGAPARRLAGGTAAADVRRDRRRSADRRGAWPASTQRRARRRGRS